MKTIHTVALMSAVFAFSASSGMANASSAKPFSQEGLPASVQVPAGNNVAMETVGKGTIWYECKAKKDAAGQFEWVFGGPDAGLWDRSGKSVGKYFGPPATWESNDGSKLTATQVAVAPAGEGNIPLQLVKANPASGKGAMMGVTYIQRVATQGGVALRIVRDRQLAEDVAHDAFVKIWHKAHTFDAGAGSGRGWVYSVVRYQALNVV